MSESDRPVATAEQQKSRRGLLTLIGAGGAAAVAALIGRNNGAEAAGATFFDTTSNPVVKTDNFGTGTALRARSVDGIGVIGRHKATASNFPMRWDIGVLGHTSDGVGVWGAAEDNTGVFGGSVGRRGVHGEGAWAGVFGQSANGYGVDGQSTNGVGVKAVGGLAPIRLTPHTTPGAPTSGAHERGEIVVDSNGVFRFCTASGTPGTWTSLTPAAGGIQFLSTPHRAADTRSGTKFATGETRNYNIASLTPGVPGTAVGAMINLTVTQTVGYGHLRAWPAGTQLPATSVINWFGYDMDVANAMTIKLGTGGISVYASTPTHVIVDVVGYM